MSAYRVSSIGGGFGFKLQVADTAESPRVVGVFEDEAIAKA